MLLFLAIYTAALATVVLAGHDYLMGGFFAAMAVAELYFTIKELKKGGK